MNRMGKTGTRTLMVAVIDDDASIRSATDRLLTSRGYVVRTFPSAAAFLQSPEIDQVACVITDVQMPVMGGIELHAELQVRGYRLPFVFITASSQQSIRATAMRGGGFGFLAKPFDTEDLMRCIEAALNAEGKSPESP
jgi:FixJ family two-component response regulator